MERLTRKSTSGNWHVGHYPMYDAYAKLAAYEDLGFEPEELKEIVEGYRRLLSAVNEVKSCGE